MFPTLVEMFDITGLSNEYITCVACTFYITNKKYITMVLTLDKGVVTYKIAYMSEPC